MTNVEIIANEALANDVFSAEQIAEFLEEGEIPLHTIQGWSARYGQRCIIKRGEHGIPTKLWKVKKVKAEDEELKEQYYLAKSYLWTRDQITVCQS